MKGLDPNSPFAPKRLPFFYGWIVAVVGTIGVLMSMPGQTMGVSVFTDPLLEATGLSRLGFSNAYLVGTLMSGILLPFGGQLLDRYGARSIAIGACLGLGLTLCALTLADQFASAIAARVPGLSSTTAAAVVLALLFTSLRFSGQGMLTMVSRAMVGKWFERRRGLVSGGVGVFINLGFSMAPVLFSAWIAVAGWRGAWLQMAAIVALGMGGTALLFYRDNPEECGLYMDGHAPEPIGVAGESAVRATDVGAADHTRGEAIRTMAFWCVTFALSIQSMVFTGVTFHIVDIGSEHGLTQAAAVGLFVPIAIVSLTMGFAVGVAADRIPLPRLVMVMMLFQTAGFFGFSQLGDPAFRLVGVAGWGLSAGFFGPLSTVAIPSFFGRAHLGAISGVQMSCLVGASALGPSLLAASKQFMGAYRPGLLACCVLSLAAFAFAAATRAPLRTAQN